MAAARRAFSESHHQGIMVFRPTLEEFQNFSSYIKKIEESGAHRAGVAKVIPPEGWRARQNYSNIDVQVSAPISQLVTGKQGLYQQFNIQKKDMTVKEFKKLANSERYCPPNETSFDELERKYWKNITFNPPMYGADVPGSLYDKDVKSWNLNHLNTILDDVKDEFGISILGVNTPYLYFGMWKSTFAWHTEDMDLYSINYIHFGAPKTWYAVPPEHGRRLERLANGFFPGSYQSCSEFLRHKMTIISPQILKRYSVPYNKIVHEAGEFMITFPYGYHCGFNHGFNCAESTNFATERWIDFGKKAEACQCMKDTVKICMDVFVKKYQPEQWEEYIMSKKKLESDTESEDEEQQIGEEVAEEDEYTEKNNKPRAKSRKRRMSKEQAYEEKSEEVKFKKSRRQPISRKRLKVQAITEQGLCKEELTNTDTSKDNCCFLPGLWKNDPANFELEKLYNQAAGSVQECCAICLLFTREKVIFPLQQFDKKNEVTEKYLEEIKKEEKVIDKMEVLDEIQTLHEMSKIERQSEETRKCTESNEKQYNDTEQKSEFHHGPSKVISSAKEHEQTHGAHIEFQNGMGKSSTKLKRSVPCVSEICFASSDSGPDISSFPYRRVSTDDESILLTCKSCCVTVHSRCYGVLDDPDNDNWLCDRCTQLQLEIIPNTHCALCCLRGGALKQTHDQRWVHIGCAIAFPEVVFDDVIRRNNVNIQKISPARWKLKCVYCRLSTNQNGACIQCCAGKCALAFHVTCSFHAGVPLYAGDWPQPVQAYCQRHQRNKSKDGVRIVTEIQLSQKVIAKHKNGRYYHSEVQDRICEDFYEVQFDDGTFCNSISPTDIGKPELNPGEVFKEGDKIQVKWQEDGLIYNAKVLSYLHVITYQIEFENGSVLNVRGEDVYSLDDMLPKKVKSRLSVATETAKKMFVEEEVMNLVKRRRTENPKYKQMSL